VEKLTEAEKTAQVFEDPRWSAHSLTMDDTKQERGKRRMTRDSMGSNFRDGFPSSRLPRSCFQQGSRFSASIHLTISHTCCSPLLTCLCIGKTMSQVSSPMRNWL